MQKVTPGIPIKIFQVRAGRLRSAAFLAYLAGLAASEFL